MLNIIFAMQEKYPLLSFSILDDLLTYHLFIMRDNIRNETRSELKQPIPFKITERRARVSGYVIGILESYLMRHPEIPDSVTALEILTDLSEIVDEHIGKLDKKFPANF